MHLKPAIFDLLKGRRIGIAGLGLEGKSTLAWLRRHGITGDVCLARDESEFPALREADCIFRSPGIHPSKLDAFLKPGAEITSQTALSLRFTAVPVLAVTGTKGKSTTASILAHVLREHGVSSFLSGNIGIPHLDVVDSVPSAQYWVMELSAQQLMDVSHAPQIALWLNWFPEHLDYFGSREAYGAAKARILGPGLGVGVVGRDVPDQWIPALPAGNVLHRFEPKACTGFPAAGPNVAPLSLVWELMGLPRDAMWHHLRSFSPLPCRLEVVGEVRGVRFVDDSLATIPQASLHAVRSLGGVRFLILGGKDRGVDPEPLLFALAREFPDTVLLLIGEMGHRLANMIPVTSPDLHHVPCCDLTAAVGYVGSHGRPGDTCLLSPAASSHDAYPDYRARSSHYRQLILGLV